MTRRSSWSLLVTSNLVNTIVTVIIVLAWTKNSSTLVGNDHRRLQEGCDPIVDPNPIVDPDPIVDPIVDPDDSSDEDNIDFEGLPDDDTWETELEDRLSDDARLFNNMFDDIDDEYEDQCDDVEGLDFIEEGRGMCMIDEDCRYQFCNRDGEKVSNLPAYTVDVRAPNDISVALEFADKYNIPVSIKTTGHNFVGSSIAKDSLNIWMANFPKDGDVDRDFEDSCGDSYTVVSINGGEVLNDVLENIEDDYHILSGDSRSVGVAGWLQGVGLSHTSRLYGLGIDNIVSFRVVLANGNQVTADACSNRDLFWALRGGGGGTFGVVVNMKYKLLPPSKITIVKFRIEERKTRALRRYLEYWTAMTPYLDNRVAGAWFESWRFELHIVGDEDLADELFLDEFRDWLDDDFDDYDYDLDVDEYDSWYDFQGGRDDYEFVRDDKDLEGIGHGPKASTRLVPLEMVLDDPDDIVDFLVDLTLDDEAFGAYWLGGVVNSVDRDATAVHPAMRSAIWAITTTSDDGARMVREKFDNSNSGCSFNHHSPSEPEWRTALWGDEHYARLLSIKEEYDPKHRFNCWHCVGYQGPEYEDD